MTAQSEVEFGLAGLLTTARKYRVSAAIGAAIICVPLLVLGLLEQRLYASSVTLMPQTSGVQATSVGSLAAQFGLSLPAREGALSLQFYGDLLTSRGTLGALAEQRFSIPLKNGDLVGTAAELNHVKMMDSARFRDAAIRLFEQRVSITLLPRSGVIRAQVLAPNPQLAEQEVLYLVHLVDKFNVERRRSQAAAERQFAEERVRDLGAQMREAEQRVRLFLEKNRQFASSPSLNFEYQSLSRDLSSKQELYVSLSQAMERARLDEVRDTPVISIIEPPEVAIRPESRRLAMRLLIAALWGAGLGVLVSALNKAMRVDSTSAIRQQRAES